MGGVTTVMGGLVTGHQSEGKYIRWDLHITYLLKLILIQYSTVFLF